jgi:hypothetical protein
VTQFFRSYCIRRAFLVVLLVWGGATFALAQPDVELPVSNEIDLFMERVLDNRDAAWRRLEGFLLREVETFEVEAPLGVPLSGFLREYEWYVRDDTVVRSPVRFDGVELDADARRSYEEEWLEREQRARGRRAGRRRGISRRSQEDNIRITIERSWGGTVDEALLARIAADADFLGHDLAAVALNTGAILDALGGVEAVGFIDAVEQTRLLFVMLDEERLSVDEVARALRRPLLALVDQLDLVEVEGDDALTGLVELATLAEAAGVDGRQVGTYLGQAADRLEATHPMTAQVLASLRAALPAAELGAVAEDALPGVEESLIDAARIEPSFISVPGFMEFTFEPGNYYFAGRETLAGREVVRVEYYPTDMFDDRADDDRSERAREIDEGFNKTSLVTLWIDPTQHQIVKQTFDNTGMGFLPGRWLVRFDGMSATMEMGQPLRDIWLPLQLTVVGEVSTALGDFDVRFTQVFDEYRETVTGGRLIDVGASGVR